MSATVSTDFLLRVAQATPPQQLAIDALLAGEHQASPTVVGESLLVRMERKLDALLAAFAEMLARGGPEADAQLPPGEAAKVFALLRGMENRPKERKAPLVNVFRLLVMEGHSQRVAAARCKCVESLVSARVATIERRFGMSIERLRNLASELQSLEQAAKGERRRKKSAGRPDDFERAENNEGEEADQPEREEDRCGDDGEDEA